MSFRSNAASQLGLQENQSNQNLSLNNSTNESSPNKENSFRLKKEIGLFGSVAVVAGTMVGSGIFASPVGVLAGTNNSVGMSLVLWAACGLISGLASLCYCELGSAIQESGANYAYLNKAYFPVVAFTYVWTAVLLSNRATSAATAVTLGSYAAAPFYVGECKPPDVVVKCAAAFMIILLHVVSYVNVKAAMAVQNVLAVAKFVGMGVIIVGGLVRLGLGDEVGLNNFQNAFRPEDLAGLGFTQIGLAFYQGLFSYNGWFRLNFLVEEVKNSKKTLPRAIMIAMPLVTVFYLLVNIGYFAVLTPRDMLESDAVAVTWGYRVLGQAGWIMSLVVCLSATGSMNGSYLSGARLPFAAARRGHMPKILSMVHTSFYTPGPSLILNCTITIIFIIPSNFNTLVAASGFTSWLFYGLCIAGVIIMRFTHPDMPRPFKVPIIIPCVTVVICGYLVVAPLVNDPDIIILYAVIFILCGPIVYFILIYKKVSIPGINYLTLFLQQLLNVAPTDWKDSS